MAENDAPNDREINEARARIAPYVARTPLVRAYALQGEARAWLKLETLQPTNSFKVRPAFNSMLARLDEARSRGVVASSSGNFAQAVAYAARELGAHARIVMPSNTSPYKIARTRAFAGRDDAVVLSGPTFDERWALTEKLQKESGSLLVHPYDSRETIAGDATLGLELLDDLGGDFTVVVPASGGGLLAGVALAVKTARPRARVVGVQSKANGSMRASFVAGSRRKSPPFTSVADSLVAAIPGENTFAIIKRLVDDVVDLEESEFLDAVKFLALEQKLVAEPGGAASVAALRTGKLGRVTGDVVCIVSGGNAIS
ncbi:MAG: threonine/serine dehydratase, partial [Deltaproteobacteria bacterium]|nr:threonine/serine dehydratase [Deltaproteobacteria bacterium]